MVVIFVTARRVSSLPCRFVKSIPAERMCSPKVAQLVLCQLRRVGAVEVGVVGIGDRRVRVIVIELWSDVVSWFVASDCMEVVMAPRERQRSIVDGVLPFLGWWVASPGSL
jgi:hypothetical protein